MDFHGVPIDELSVDGCKFVLAMLEQDAQKNKEDIEYLKRCIEIKEGQ